MLVIGTKLFCLGIKSFWSDDMPPWELDKSQIDQDTQKPKL